MGTGWSGWKLDIEFQPKYLLCDVTALNYNGGVPVVIPATFSLGDWIEWLSKPCSPGMTGDLEADNDDSTCQINIEPAQSFQRSMNIKLVLTK